MGKIQECDAGVAVGKIRGKILEVTQVLITVDDPKLRLTPLPDPNCTNPTHQSSTFNPTLYPAFTHCYTCIPAVGCRCSNAVHVCILPNAVCLAAEL